MALPDWLPDTSSIITPAVVIHAAAVDRNLDRIVAIAGDVRRLRPHCKTHKTREIAQRLIARGITKHKAATFAEAELLVNAGAVDIFLAYNLVGANIARAVAFRQKYPGVRLAVTADHPQPVAALSAAMSAAMQSIDVLLDIDSGQHRTGLPVGPEAVKLYQQIAHSPGLRAAGFHLYDGQNHQVDLEQRRVAVLDCWRQATELRAQVEAAGFVVPAIVAGGTGSFPVYATIDDPAIELSPGTCIFHDAGYGAMFPDLKFEPAAFLLTRVISRPTPQRVTFDLGYKAVASDPPADRRVSFPGIPDAKIVLQNEEHLVIETEQAARFSPGDEEIAIPRHVCPTSALHKQLFVVENGTWATPWQVAARDRWLTV